jgi:hypothetical protein
VILRRACEHPHRLDTNPALGGLFGELLVQRWSQQQIAGICTFGLVMTRRCGYFTRAPFGLFNGSVRPSHALPGLEFPPLSRQRGFGCQAATAGAVGRVLS